MRGNTIRKILVALIIIIPVFSDSGCRKQAKCGCGKDVLFTFEGTEANIYWESSSSIYFQTVGDYYSTYTVCNPTEMFPKLVDAKAGDVLLVTGSVYWDCNFIYQSSNSSYQSYYKVYNVQLTNMVQNLYGKK